MLFASIDNLFAACSCIFLIGMFCLSIYMASKFKNLGNALVKAGMLYSVAWSGYAIGVASLQIFAHTSSGQQGLLFIMAVTTDSLTKMVISATRKDVESEAA